MGLNPDCDMCRVLRIGVTSACNAPTPASPPPILRTARTRPSWFSRHRS
jgi:hypothetical protein